MPDYLPTIEIETAPQPKFAVIWLHGLGADGSDFVPLAEQFELPAPTRFIFPHAPMIPVTCNGGYVMRAWYDLDFLDGKRRADVTGIGTSCKAVGDLIARENERGIPPGNVVLGGFSQGGAIAYTAGLTHPQRLAAIVALSTYIPVPGLLLAGFGEANRGTPIFAAHGSDDDVVPPALGVAARELLLAHGCVVEWHTYDMPHAVCSEEIAAIGKWLAGRLAAGSGQ